MVLALLIFLFFAFKSAAFQTWVGHRVAEYLSAELNTTVKIGSIDIGFFDYAVVRDLYVADQHNDTLLYAPRVTCYLGSISLSKEEIRIDLAEFEKPVVRLKKYEGEKDMNFAFIEDYFSSDKPKDTTSKGGWGLSCERILLNEADFAYHDYNRKPIEYGLDFNHICLSNLSIDAANFRQVADTSMVRFNRITVKDCSGFDLDTLRADFKFSKTLMSFDSLFIRTPDSRIDIPSLSFSYGSTDDFSDFTDKVKMRADLRSSLVSLDDIAFFVPDLKGIDRQVLLSSRVYGTVNDLTLKRLGLYLSETTFLEGDLTMVGITDIEKAFIAAELKSFSTTRHDLQTIKLPPFDSTAFISLPPNLARLGQITGSASFTGTLNDFVAYSRIQTAVGAVRTDLRVHVDSAENLYHYKGDLMTSAFNIGYLFDIPDMGKVSFDLDLDARELSNVGSRDELGLISRLNYMRADILGKVSLFEYRGYKYRNIALDGRLESQLFSGELSVRDENLDLTYAGEINFEEKTPRFNFTVDLDKANLGQLNLSDRDELSNLTLQMSANASGSSLDNFEGTVVIAEVQYEEKGQIYHLDSIGITANKVGEEKQLTFSSPILDLQILGTYFFTDLPVSFMSILSEAMPALFDNEVFTVKGEQLFTYDVLIKDFSMVTQLFVPAVALSPNTRINGRIDSYKNIFRLRTDPIASLEVGGRVFRNFTVNARNNGDYLVLNTRATDIFIDDSLSLQNFTLDGELYQNKMATTIAWMNRDSASWGTILGEGLVHSPQFFEFDIKPSQFQITKATGTWHLDESSHVEIRGDTVHIADFNIYNDKQIITVAGTISSDPADSLAIDICDFEMSNLNTLIGNPNMVLKGKLNGTGYISDAYNDVFLSADVSLDSFYINKDYLGDFHLVNAWDPVNKAIYTVGDLQRKEMPSLHFEGRYYAGNGGNSLDYRVKMDQLNLIFLNAFLPSDISNLRGLASGEISLRGTPSEPLVRGKVNFDYGSVKVNMLNTEYYFGGEVKLFEDLIAFDSIPLVDLKGNMGWAQGALRHTNYGNWNFSTQLEFNKLLCLNTTEDMNPLYYGRAYASGRVNVFTSGGGIEVDVNVKTEKGTRVVLPLYGSSDVTLQDFVRFVSAADSNQIAVSNKVDLSGITLNFEFDVTPDAEMQIVFDKLAGDMIRAKGSGHISLGIDQLGQFSMYGQYVVDQGDYYFTLMNVINKHFTVKKGSTINWYGDPYTADIDLTAVYKVQASPFELMPSDLAPQYRNNMEVECEMSLKQSLFQPLITFNINIPRADENLRAALTVIRASEQEMSRQFFALLAINKFLPLTNTISNAAQSGLAATTGELLSSQLSNWLSQISDEFDVGVNYKPGDEISNEEIAVALSTQFFNDRLIVKGNVGVSSGNRTNQNPNSLIGDFNVEYKINQDGTFRVRAFNESNEFDITNTSQAPYTQGAGIYYTEEFDRLSELRIIQRIQKLFTRRKRRTPVQTPVPAQTPTPTPVQTEDKNSEKGTLRKEEE